MFAISINRIGNLTYGEMYNVEVSTTVSGVEGPYSNIGTVVIREL